MRQWLVLELWQFHAWIRTIKIAVEVSSNTAADLLHPPLSIHEITASFVLDIKVVRKASFEAFFPFIHQ